MQADPDHARSSGVDRPRKSLRWLLLLVIAAGCIVAFVFGGRLHQSAAMLTQRGTGKHTVADRVAEFGEVVHGRLDPAFARIQVPYPPQQVVLVGLKQERLLEVWVRGEQTPLRLLKTYPILGASGRLGPKLREGDRQVPEGLYRIESLNPNSLYHLALRVNYPNAFDKAKARAEGREYPGSDIMIHGKTASIGCLAMGDEAAEDLFVLAAETGIENIAVILSPVDFRVRQLPGDMPAVPAWTAGLYEQVAAELSKLKATP
jgi:hypothetical protein